MIFDILKKTSESHKDKTAIICNSEEISYGNLVRYVEEIAGVFKTNGMKSKMHIAIIMGNSVEFIEAFFSINSCEAVIIPIYLNTGISKIINIINYYNIEYVVTLTENKNSINNVVLKECYTLKGIFYLGQHKVSDFSECDRPAGCKELTGVDSDCDKAIILFSSGTTNIPKGIMLTEHNICSNVEAISDYLEVNALDRILLVKNINHASSITGEMLVSLYRGCTLVLTNNLPVPSVILELIEKQSITTFFAVPTILFSLINSKDFCKYNLSSLKVINFYGASIGYSEICNIAEKFSWVNLMYSYGLTEASPRVTYIKRDDLLRKKGASGKPIKGVQVFIEDETGRSVENGTIGEIVVKGPNVMQGYYKNAELTKKALRNGLLHTGDLGMLDSDGYLYVLGRKDNLIVLSGKNVYPEEIESVLYNINGVKEVLVRGESDSFLGQKIVAYLVVEQDCKLNDRDVLFFCRSNLEDYKLPREIRFVDKLEKTPSGKIIRKQELVKV